MVLPPLWDGKGEELGEALGVRVGDGKELGEALGVGVGVDVLLLHGPATTDTRVRYQKDTSCCPLNDNTLKEPFDITVKLYSVHGSWVQLTRFNNTVESHDTTNSFGVPKPFPNKNDKQYSASGHVAKDCWMSLKSPTQPNSHAGAPCHMVVWQDPLAKQAPSHSSVELKLPS